MIRMNYALAALGVVAIAATTARAQTNFPETEPNSAKIESNVVGCMVPGDTITGTSTGGVTVAGNTALDTTDYFRVKTCSLPLGIYRHTLTLTTATPGHTGSMRGLTQTGGFPNAGTDVAIQTLTGTQQHWYGFGKSEEIITRVTGTPSTTSPYTHTLSTSSASAASIGTFSAGSITITACGQGHTADTDIWVYDGSLNAIPAFGNDDQSPPCAGHALGSTLTQTYSAGTYYLAMGTYNLANNLGSTGPGEGFLTGAVMDFPDAIMESSTAVSGNVAFAVTDSAGTTPVAATKTVWYEIVWFTFDVGTANPGSAFCTPGDGAGTIACPCGNAPGGADRGCNNSGASGGSAISGTGTANVTTPNDTLVLSANGIASSTGSCAGFTDTLTWILLQGQTASAVNLAFHDGVRCVGGSLKRIQSATSVGGVATSTVGISATSASLGDTIIGGTSRDYQFWYRDPCPTFACPISGTLNNANISNGYRVAWQ